MSRGNNLLIFVAISLIGAVRCESRTCTVDGQLKFCEAGCCSNACCDTWSTAMIVGTVIGGLSLLASIVFCGICIYCMCKKKKQHDVQPMQNTNSVYVHNSPYGGGYNQYQPPTNPPSYSQAGAFPSGYDAAFPPGSVSHPPPAYTFNNQGKK